MHCTLALLQLFPFAEAADCASARISAAAAARSRGSCCQAFTYDSTVQREREIQFSSRERSAVHYVYSALLLCKQTRAAEASWRP